MLLGMRAGVPPGALQRDTARSILVFSESGEPAVALREHVPPHRALIRDVRPSEATAALAACLPYPLLVAGSGEVPAEVIGLLRTAPVLGRWLAPAPALQGNWQRHLGFRELVVDICQLLAREVAGMRLAPSQGVLMPDGRMVSSPQLQALVAAHPGGFPADRARFRSVSALLRRHGVPARLSADERSGDLVLR